MKKIGLLSLMAVMGLFLSFCAKAATPITDGKNPSEWESLPEYNSIPASSYIRLKVSDGTKAEIVDITDKTWPVDKKQPLLVHPKSGKPFIKLEPLELNYDVYGDIIGRYIINKNGGLISGAVPFHVYINGVYIDSGEDSSIGDNLIAPNSKTNKYSYEKVLAMKANDTLQVIADFTVNKVHYKWTSPLLKFE